jgi:hypothetical protein
VEVEVEVEVKEMDAMVHAGRFWGAAALVGIVAATPACGDDDPDEIVVVEPPTGALTVDYTIAGTTVPESCVGIGASDVELLVYDDLGYYLTGQYAPCERFYVSVGLYPGYYSADVTLVDPFNNAATTTAQLDDLRVFADSELVVAVDFPPGSVL